jgi:hypothetical protein
MMFEGVLAAVASFFVLVMVSAGSMNYAENSIKKDCAKLKQFYIGDVVYECKEKNT